LNAINLSASSYLNHAWQKDKICSFDLAEQMKAGIKDSALVAFKHSGHSLFLEETKKFNEELIKFALE
jgi:pimeloyl-ACP methyl ester carboxylesterase